MRLLQIFLLATFPFFNLTIAQNAPSNNKVPQSLYGEWYNIEDGNIDLGIYNNMVIYSKEQWTIDSLTTSGAGHFMLRVKGELGTRIIQINLNSQNAHFSDKMGKKWTGSKHLDDCKSIHNIPEVHGQIFKKDFVWYDCYFEDTATLHSNIQVQVSTYDLISNQTNYSIQFISSEGSMRFRIPVLRPLTLNVSFSDGRKEHLYLQPGKQLIEVVTKDRGSIFMGDAAPLTKEMQQFYGNHHIFPDAAEFVFPLALPSDSIAAIGPHEYKQIVLRQKAKSKAILDSLLSTKSISPLTHQIQNLNIEYAFADMLLHYNQNRTIALNYYQVYFETLDLDPSYFNFLQGMDNELGPIAPYYAPFINSLRANDTLADVFIPGKILMQQIPLHSIDTLNNILKLLPEKSTLLEETQLKLIDSFNLLQNNAAAKSVFLQRHESEISSLLDQNGYLIVFATIGAIGKKYIRDHFRWRPGTLTDLILMAHLANQIRDQAPLPDYFFNPEKGYFSNPFIARHLLDIKNPSDVKGVVPSTTTHQLQQALKRTWSLIDTSKVVSIDTICKSGLALIFVSYDKTFPLDRKQKMEETFFTVYPQQIALYNKAAPKRITFIVDPDYNGIAATADSLTRYNPTWFNMHPNDIDVVTHEVMHITQCYQKNNYQPRWIAEGIADYVRLRMGLYNKAANWVVPVYDSSQHVEDGYRITARFFNWLEKHKKKGIIQRLDLAMRTGHYNESFWSKQTSESLKQLWKDYSRDPAL